MNESERISNLCKEYKIPFKACDNISSMLEPDSLWKLQNELTLKFQEVLKGLIIDVENDPNSYDTAKRLAKMYLFEIMAGRYNPLPDVAAFPNEGDNKYEGMLVVRSEIKSLCAHHHQPVSGVAYIGVIPGAKVIGLSKYSRLAQWCAARGTLQEELTMQIHRTIEWKTESKDIAVHLECRHGCCENRGIRAKSSLTQTTMLSGEFNKPDVKAEFFDNVRMQKGQ